MVKTREQTWVIRHYRPGEEAKMAALVNACRTEEGEGPVTVDMIRNEWRDARLKLARDTWVALNEEGDYVAVAEVWFNDPDNDEAVVTRHIGFAMHPDYRETDPKLMEELLSRALAHASTHPLSQPSRDYVLRAWAAADDTWKHQIILDHGFQHVHSGYTMIREPLDDLPPVPKVEGIQIVGWSARRDRDLWQALNEGFSTEEDFRPLTWEEWQRLYHSPHTNPDLWCIAVEEATDAIVGLALSEIDELSNEELERKDGWVVDLAVLEPWRGQGLGRALLLAAMHTLLAEGMTAVKLGIDSNDPEHATRLYDGLGFTVLHGSHTYIKPLKR